MVLCTQRHVGVPDPKAVRAFGADRKQIAIPAAQRSAEK